MARPLRLEFEGAVYHVTSRGHERARIFTDNSDRELYLDGLRRVVEEMRWIVHGYCLMTNHTHLLVETPAGNLSSGMLPLNSRYGQAYNRRHGRAGHLLEGRYRAILVDADAHLLELCRYVVLNPVRARMVRSPGQYRWSNYRATAGDAAAPPWLETRWTLERFGDDLESAREAYRRFVLAGKGLPSPMEKVTGQIYLGGPEFLSMIEKKLKQRKPGKAIPRAQQRVRFVPIADIRKAVAAHFGVEEAALSRPRGGAEKVAAIYLSRRLSGLGGSRVAAAFGVTPGRVSHIVKQIERGEWTELEEVLGKLERALNREASTGTSR